jgi:glycerophosphoryl diester phosphodiesterase
MLPHTALRTDRAMVFAHRGGALLRPENTIAAFDHALALGVDGFELDVRLSRDGEVVVHHDRTLDRTTGVGGTVDSRTADELAALDAGARFDEPGGLPFRNRGVGVPRLAEILDRYPRVSLIVEMKANSVELALATIAAVRAAGAAGRVMLGSFHRRVQRAVRTTAPELPTGAGREEVRWALYRSRVGWPVRRPLYQALQVPEVSGWTRVVTPRFVRDVHQAGVPVQVWTVNREPDMRRLLAWGVDALITDRPDIAVRVVRGG